MNTFLWIIAGLLAAAFLVGGGLKVILPKDKIRAASRIREMDAAAWTEDFRAGSIKAIGVLEVLAAIGLILPPVLGIAPVLAPLAALGFVLLMIGAAITHIRRKEARAVVGNLVYLTLADSDEQLEPEEEADDGPSEDDSDENEDEDPTEGVVHGYDPGPPPAGDQSNSP